MEKYRNRRLKVLSPAHLPVSINRLTDKEPHNHKRMNFKDTNPLMSSLLVTFVWGGDAIL
jgi:hypothetical protein